MSDQDRSPPAVTRRHGGLLTAGIVACNIACLTWAYLGWVHPNIFPRNFGIVEPGKLYRSAALTPAAFARVAREHGIRTIVDLGGFDKDPVGERTAQRTAEALGIQRYVFELEGDGTGNPNAYVAALRVLADPSKHPVLVHCSAGAQRTSGCIMLYKDIVLGKPLAETYPESRRYKHDPRDNPRLFPFVQQHEPKIAEAFRAGGQIDGFPALDLTPRRSP